MDDRLKRLHHKCKYMGMHENDAIFGRFAERYLDDLSDEELGMFEALIAENDVELFKWVTEKQPIPEQYQNSIMDKLQACRDYVRK